LRAVGPQASENRKREIQQSAHVQAHAMLTVINTLQLVLYIALLALLGQGILYVLAGSRRESNVFYKLLQVVAKPFTWPVRQITPRQVSDAQVPIVTFLLLAVIYAIVTFERANLCVTSGLLGQPGCR
jgi:uncharacterized protein YggT (Ycf19 family)